MNRNSEKANEWLAKLNNQDIQTVGDLSSLTEADWNNIGLTVFACRAMKNALSLSKATKAANMIMITNNGNSDVYQANVTQPTIPGQHLKDVGTAVLDSESVVDEKRVPDLSPPPLSDTS